MHEEGSTEVPNQSTTNLVIEPQLSNVDDSATAEVLDPETEPIVPEVETQKTSSEAQIESQPVDGSRISQEKVEVNESTTKSQVETQGLADSEQAETVTEIENPSFVQTNPSLPLPEIVNEETITESATEPAAEASDVIPAVDVIQTSISQTSEVPPPEPIAFIGSEEEVTAPPLEVVTLAEELPEEKESPTVSVPPPTTTPKRISKRNRSSSRKKSTERQQTIEYPPQPPVVNLNDQFHPRPRHQRQHCPEHVSSEARKTPKY